MISSSWDLSLSPLPQQVYFFFQVCVYNSRYCIITGYLGFSKCITGTQAFFYLWIIINWQPGRLLGIHNSICKQRNEPLCFWNMSKTVNFSPRKLAALPKFFSLQSLTNTYAINVVDRMLLHDSKKTEIREDACGYSHCPTNMA